MTPAQSNPRTLDRPLRLWPGIALALLQWLSWLVVPAVAPAASMYAILGALVAGPAIRLWWAFFSRAPGVERFGAVVLVVGAMAATKPLLHESIAQGNMGFQFFLYAIPLVSLAFVLWAVASRRLPTGLRRATMVAAVLLACGVLLVLRSRGITGDGMPEFTWRWSATPEERLLASASDGTVAVSWAPEAVPAAAEWPGFRGPGRSGVVPGLRLATDWSTSPPVELWRRPIGPGVSSFAVQGDRLYTQEQRGEEEIVACYQLTTGKPIWKHIDSARFWDSHVGAGPRATPALSAGRVFTLGATGILSALDAGDGTVVWTRNAGADTEASDPHWGYVSSPLVIADTVVVHVGQLVAYDIATGEPRWFGPEGGSYSSPHLLTIDGVEQIVLMTHAGAIGVAPADGALLWEHSWEGIGVMQPALTADGDLLIGLIDDGAQPRGTRRIAVAQETGAWTTHEVWTSTRLRPSFSPSVVHEGHAIGFDNRFLVRIDTADGERKGKAGRYGSGQILLLPDQDLLLVVSEKGGLALVRANDEEFAEIARVPALEGKTWNQPALVGDLLLVRNREEMAAFKLALAGG